MILLPGASFHETKGQNYNRDFACDHGDRHVCLQFFHAENNFIHIVCRSRMRHDRFAGPRSDKTEKIEAGNKDWQNRAQMRPVTLRLERLRREA